ncbi:MAG TPA: hypothetical protein VI299_02560, partial [Polyangiales bacterium]
IAGGLGYTYSGPRPSDGVTGPLWLLPLVAAARLGLSTVALAKALSLAASVVAAGAVVARARRGAQGAQAAWWVALVCASSLPFVAWSVAGLETGLAALLTTWLSLAASRRCDVQAGVAVAALAWLRPELAAFALVLLWSVRSQRAWVLALWGALTVLAFRWSWFGHLLPMTASAKPAWLGHGVQYLAHAFVEPRVVLLASSLGIALAYGDRRTRVLTLALAAHALAVVLAGGDWMPARRLLVPVLPVTAWVVARGMRRFALRRPRLAHAWIAAIAVLGLRELGAELPALREAGARRERELPRLVQLACGGGPIAMIDVGALGVACPSQSIVDLAGLTEPAIAYARGGHLDKQVDERWLSEQRLRALVLHSRERPRMDVHGRLRWFAGYPVERRVLSFALARELRVRGVVEYAPSYFYVVLAPR